MMPWFARTGIGARPAIGFPFRGHLTCDDVHKERYAHHGPTLDYDRIVGLSPDRGKRGLQKLASLPPTPCFRCGDRGWCGHNGRTAQ